MTVNLLDFDLDGLAAFCETLGEKRFRATQLFRWIHQKGATDPKKAAAGTIRADFADSIDANAVHGSDAADTARHEVGFFFPGMNVYSRLS